MKEVSIEQKAKRYDEAIAYAKKLLKTIGSATLGNLVLKNEFERMFPELKESEDENIRLRLIDYLYGKSRLAKDREDGISWLKSLSPQSQWKPSEEQMEVIEAVINNRSFQRRHLDSLYNDLKKLKG